MKFYKKKRFWIPVLFLAFIGLGPKASYSDIDPTPRSMDLSIDQIDAFLMEKEAKVEKIKPDNHSRVIWQDSLRRKTPYSIVYLHGFSASPMEADPIHFEFAKRYGFNMYLSRLAGHGIDDIESFKDLTPHDLIESAKEALAIGQLIGEKVIVMSCSTGSTLSIYLAATQPAQIESMIMYSPNIDLYDAKSQMLLGPWGLPLAKWMGGGDYRSFTLAEGGAQYWTTKYRIEGVLALRDLLNQTMTEENFQKITQPFYIGYYYKSAEKSDHVISINAIHDFFDKTSTPADKKVKEAYPNGGHVLPSHFQSRDLEAVRKQTFEYADKVLGLKPIN